MLAVLDEVQDLLTRVDLTVHSESLQGIAWIKNEWARQAFSLMIDPYTFELKVPEECLCLIVRMEEETAATA